MKKRINLFAATIILSLAVACTRAPESDKATTTVAKQETDDAVGKTYKVDTEAEQDRMDWH